MISGFRFPPPTTYLLPVRRRANIKMVETQQTQAGPSRPSPPSLSGDGAEKKQPVVILCIGMAGSVRFPSLPY